jgi:hypothetical protein
MTHNDFSQLRQTVAALSPEQMRRLRDELDQKLSALATAASSGSQADPLVGLWHDYADQMDEIVADAYGKRREGEWREFDL